MARSPPGGGPALWPREPPNDRISKNVPRGRFDLSKVKGLPPAGSHAGGVFRGVQLRILAELDEPGAKFADVARRHEVSRGLLWQWRNARRRGALVAEEPTFVPLRVVPELPAPEPQGTAAASPPSGDPVAEPDDRIEIVLPDGTAVRVTEAIGAAALRRVLAALRG
jgi:transposase